MPLRRASAWRILLPVKLKKALETVLKGKTPPAFLHLLKRAYQIWLNSGIMESNPGIPHFIRSHAADHLMLAWRMYRSRIFPDKCSPKSERCLLRNYHS